VGLSALVVVLWFSPVSPVAIGRADALLGQGDALAAAQAYDRVAKQNPWRRLRQEALYKGALVYALELRDSEGSRDRLMRLVRQGDTRRAAEAWQAIGHLRLDEGDIRAAAQAFENAWAVDPAAPVAADRLELCARSRAEGGQTMAADRIWQRVEQEYPERSATALLARGEMRLAEGDVEGALDLYQRAEKAAADGDVAVVARLGAATCLERMGDLDQALVAIDSLDLPDELLEARRQGILARHAKSAGAL
jgi:TolA-binding protein